MIAFVAVVDNSNFSTAAREVGLQPSFILRRINWVENRYDLPGVAWSLSGSLEQSGKSRRTAIRRNSG
ncbi:LysR family transcriptional regulator [uncultured Ruegeria sp.]|uniref:helix-turn-helix domain-containing protein n=1 Tax=uncultured Ruegeria sp. TaxID=259304 RepID=UPI00345C16F6